MFPKKLVLGEMQKTQVLCYQALAFLCISKIRDLLLNSSLRGGETCDGHAEWRAGCVVHADAGAELH